MRNIWTIARREYRHYFISPIAYVFLFISLLTLGIFFYLDIIFALSTMQYVPSSQQTLSLLVFPLFFLGIPALTMRSIADENRTGTMELLLTSPVHDWELIAGKWLGVLLFFLTIIGITWIYPIILNSMIDPGIDQGTLVTGYLGLILITSAMCAIGVMVSSFFSNQIAALFATIGLLILFWIIGSPAQVADGPIPQLLKYLSLPEHYYESFLNGSLHLTDVIYYVSLTFLALFFGSVSVQARRWR